MNDEKNPRPFFLNIDELCPLCGNFANQRYVRTISEKEQEYLCEHCEQTHPREAWIHTPKGQSSDFVGPIV